MHRTPYSRQSLPSPKRRRNSAADGRHSKSIRRYAEPTNNRNLNGPWKSTSKKFPVYTAHEPHTHENSCTNRSTRSHARQRRGSRFTTENWWRTQLPRTETKRKQPTHSQTRDNTQKHCPRRNKPTQNDTGSSNSHRRGRRRRPVGQLRADQTQLRSQPSLLFASLRFPSLPFSSLPFPSSCLFTPAAHRERRPRL